MERRLAVILAANIVGYSRLMATDEKGMHARRYTAKILKGVKPSDLPIEQPMRFDLVLNPNKCLVLTIPPSVLMKADHRQRVMLAKALRIRPGGAPGAYRRRRSM
jgi:hypothetical protein